eukprot:6679625-Alexandrium_andersonii.AAC.1
MINLVAEIGSGTNARLGEAADRASPTGRTVLQGLESVNNWRPGTQRRAKRGAPRVGPCGWGSP